MSFALAKSDNASSTSSFSTTSNAVLYVFKLHMHVIALLHVVHAYVIIVGLYGHNGNFPICGMAL